VRLEVWDRHYYTALAKARAAHALPRAPPGSAALRGWSPLHDACRICHQLRASAAAVSCCCMDRSSAGGGQQRRLPVPRPVRAYLLRNGSSWLEGSTRRSRGAFAGQAEAGDEAAAAISAYLALPDCLEALNTVLTRALGVALVPVPLRPGAPALQMHGA